MRSRNRTNLLFILGNVTYSVFNTNEDISEFNPESSSEISICELSIFYTVFFIINITKILLIKGMSHEFNGKKNGSQSCHGCDLLFRKNGQR